MKALLFAAVLLAALPMAQATTVSPSTFSATVSHGETYQANFRITPDSADEFALADSSVFALSYPASLSLSSFEDVEFTAAIPKHFPAGTYQSKIFVQDSDETDIVAITLTIPEDRTLAIAPGSLSLSAGQSGIQEMNASNTGNVPLRVSLVDSGHFAAQYDELLVLPGQRTALPFRFSIPDNASVGNVSQVLNFTLNGQPFAYTLNFTVVDQTPPDVRLVDPAPMNFSPSLKIPLNITDAYGVVHAVATVKNATAEIFPVGGDYFLELSHTDIAQPLVPVGIVARDANGQIANATLNLTFARGQSYIVEPFTALEISVNRSYSQGLASFARPVNVTVMLDQESLEWQPANLNSNNSLPYEVFVDTGSGRVNLDGSAKEIIHPRDLRIGIAPTEEGHLSGTVIVDVPDWYGEDISYPFSLRIGTMDVLLNYTREIAYGGGLHTEKCAIAEGATLAESFYECQSRYPITADLTRIPKYSDSDYELMRQQVGLALERERESKGTWKALFFLAMLVTLGMAGYVGYEKWKDGSLPFGGR